MTSDSPKVSPIPIRNIYFLLVYAWDRLAEAEKASAAGIDSNELVDLFASMLIGATEQLLRRGLERTYSQLEEETAGVRGKIHVGETVRRLLLPHGRSACFVDELSVNTLPNQIIRSTIELLVGVPQLDTRLRISLRRIAKEMVGVDCFSVGLADFRGVRLHGNNGFYRFALDICKLVVQMKLASEGGPGYLLRDFLRDERAMARLFESFLFNFFRIERDDLVVNREQLAWNARSTSDPDLLLLPRMETDITLRDNPHTQTLIIDAKFYKELFQKRFEKQKIRSSHLYQMQAYLNSMRFLGGANECCNGVLMYPSVDRSVDLSYEFEGYSLSVRTVDLSADWKDIRADLLGFAEQHFS